MERQAMNLAPFEQCVCRRMGGTLSLCVGANQFSENGIKVRHTTRSGENVVGLVLDGCVFTDNQTKCDGLFVFETQNNNVLSLVELKGTDITHAFEQIDHVKNHTTQYTQIKQMVSEQVIGQLNERAFIISNAIISKPEKEKLENHHQLRITQILHSEATTPVPDIRNYL